MIGAQMAGREQPRPQNLSVYLRRLEQETTERARSVPRMDEDIPFSFSDGSRWYAVMTNIRCEERAENGLAAKGFRTFLPKTRHWVKHARVRKAVDRPLLSRYLFVETDANRRGFHDIRITDGVEAIISTCGVPSHMPPGLIEEFMRRQMCGEFDFVTPGEVQYLDAHGKRQARENPAMPPGARIKIMDGQYGDFFATVVSVGKASGGEVLAQLLGTRTRHRFALLNVRPA